MSITLKCRKHPRYMAVREPLSLCGACWALYRLTNGALEEVRYPLHVGGQIVRGNTGDIKVLRHG